MYKVPTLPTLAASTGRNFETKTVLQSKCDDRKESGGESNYWRYIKSVMINPQFAHVLRQSYKEPLKHEHCSAEKKGHSICTAAAVTRLSTTSPPCLA